MGFIGLNAAQRLLPRGNLAFWEEIGEEKQPLLSQSYQIYVPKLTIFKSEKSRISLSLWISLSCLLQSPRDAADPLISCSLGCLAQGIWERGGRGTTS